MKKAVRWGVYCAVVGAALGIALSITDHLLVWPLTSLTPEGVKYLIGSIAVPVVILGLIGFCAGLGAGKRKPAVPRK